jgi:hypothetical protein
MTAQKNKGLRDATDSSFGRTNCLKTGKPAAGWVSLAVRLEESAVRREETDDRELTLRPMMGLPPGI